MITDPFLDKSQLVGWFGLFFAKVIFCEPHPLASGDQLQANRMYCLSCHLFESELKLNFNDKNEPNWIQIGISNWKKGVEKN